MVIWRDRLIEPAPVFFDSGSSIHFVKESLNIARSMQHAHHHNSISCWFVEDEIVADGHAPQPRTVIITRLAGAGHSGTAIDLRIDRTEQLRRRPLVIHGDIAKDGTQVHLGQCRPYRFRHRSSPPSATLLV